MAESNDQPPRCQCGFWGSVQYSGLCSVCYKRQQQQNKDHEPKLFVSTRNSTMALSSAATDSDVKCQAITAPDSIAPIDMQLTMNEVTVNTELPVSTEAAIGANMLETTNLASQATVMDSSESASSASVGLTVDSLSRPVQKNKKRCFTCKARLELAFVEIGRCKCGFTFCEMHRLPEQHACTFDHKESGRKEARDKMVSPKKHVGTTLKRLDSDS